MAEKRLLAFPNQRVERVRRVCLRTCVHLHPHLMSGFGCLKERFQSSLFLIERMCLSVSAAAHCRGFDSAATGQWPATLGGCACS